MGVFYFGWYRLCCFMLLLYYELCSPCCGFFMSWGILPCFRSSWQNLDWFEGAEDCSVMKKLPEDFAELMVLWAVTYSLLFINSEILHATCQGFNCSWHYRPIAGGRYLDEMGCFWGYLQCENFPGTIVIQSSAGLKRSYLQIKENFTFHF